MKKFITLIFTLMVSATTFAQVQEEEALNFLVEKTIEDFSKGIELYNNSRPPGTPIITETDSVYKFKVKKNSFEFSLLNYLNDQISVNGKLVQKSELGLNKTTWIDSFITKAFADDMPTLDAESTKILLTALGHLSGKLDEIGMTCFSGCTKETRQKNLKKILATLDRQKAECEREAEAQDDSIIRYQTYKTIKSLHSIASPTFQGVKSFFEKIAATNKKTVQAFMEDKLGVENAPKNCMGIMTVGTVADGQFDDMKRGLAVLRGGGPGTIQMESALENAKNACIKLEDLKRCALSVKEKLGTINSHKRLDKVNAGKGQEELPNINALER